MSDEIRPDEIIPDETIPGEETEEAEEAEEEIKEKRTLKEKIRRNIPLPARIVLAILPFAIIVHIISAFSTGFSDFFNRYISSVIRMILAKLTGWIPFSLGETLVVCLPLMIVILFIVCLRKINTDDVSGNRAVFSLVAIIAGMYSLFALSFGVAYNTSTLDRKLDLERDKVSAEELYRTAMILNEKVNAEIDYIDFDGGSVMRYSISELNEKINDAYADADDKYEFLPPLRSNIKCIALSKYLTYTHISGMYAYYTGEANLNINFPDYVLPYTVAHELAHQRGIAREEEANFVAFLVCMESDDHYVRYSAYMNVLEYVLSALSDADDDLYSKAISALDGRAIIEMREYNKFFKQYRNSSASKVSDAVNDAYLKSQGQKEGSRSYDLVVDLAVAYYKVPENR